MTGRSTSDLVHDRAKVAAIRDLTSRHRGSFDMLRFGWAKEVFREDSTLTSKVRNDRARSRAISDLIDLYRDEYEQLRAEYVDRLKEELGWTDERAGANRARKAGNLPRGQHGRWVSAAN